MNCLIALVPNHLAQSQALSHSNRARDRTTVTASPGHIGEPCSHAFPHAWHLDPSHLLHTGCAMMEWEKVAGCDLVLVKESEHQGQPNI